MSGTITHQLYGSDDEAQPAAAGEPPAVPDESPADSKPTRKRKATTDVAECERAAAEAGSARRVEGNPLTRAPGLAPPQ